MRRILVLRGGALGDFIVTLPALALLRERWPEATIELAGNATAATLAKTRGLLDTAHSQHERRWSALFAPAPLPVDFAAWLGSFDLVLNYWPDPAGDLARRLPLRSGQTFISAPALPACAPAAAHYCAPLVRLGLHARDFSFQLRPRGQPAPEAPILFHPGSGSPGKNWPRDRWLELFRQLSAPARLVLGEAESETWEKDTGLSCLIRPPLEDLAAHLAACRLFVGHDSGVSHLAAACGAPCVLLFGPTDPAMWAPPGRHVRVIQRSRDLSSISVAEVRAALDSPPPAI